MRTASIRKPPQSYHPIAPFCTIYLFVPHPQTHPQKLSKFKFKYITAHCGMCVLYCGSKSVCYYHSSFPAGVTPVITHTRCTVPQIANGSNYTVGVITGKQATQVICAY